MRLGTEIPLAKIVAFMQGFELHALEIMILIGFLAIVFLNYRINTSSLVTLAPIPYGSEVSHAIIVASRSLRAG